MKVLRNLLIPALVVPILCFTPIRLVKAQSNPVPLLNQPMVPDATAPGGQAFTLTVNGTGFVSGATVNWNGSPRITAFLSGSQLNAQISAADIASAGSVSVTVTNPGTSPSNPMPFHVATPSFLVNFVRTDIPAGTSPYNIASGDFNGDGTPHLAVGADSNGSSVTILLGNGDGTFSVGGTYTVVAAPASIVAADFNGDGKLDLAIGSYTTSAISILLGNGDGTFQAQTTYATGAWPLSLAAADLNGDGKLDLVTANDHDSTVSVLLGNGDGTFQNHADFGAGAGTSSVAVGDFNGDGKLDLAVGGPLEGVAVLIGDGDGTFNPPVNNPTGGLVSGVVLADFNGDGKLDIAAAVITNQSIIYLT